MPKLGEALMGKKGKIKQKSTLTPGQQELMALLSEGLTTGQGPFSSLFGEFDKGAFEEGVTKPALANFQENILPSIQEKFIAGNQVLGSGFRNAQLKAATNLQTQLAGLMYNAQQAQKQNKLAGLQTALGTRGIENIYKPGTTGIVPGAIQGLAQGFGQGFGSSLAGGGGGGGGGAAAIAG